MIFTCNSNGMEKILKLCSLISQHYISQPRWLAYIQDYTLEVCYNNFSIFSQRDSSFVQARDRGIMCVQSIISVLPLLLLYLGDIVLYWTRAGSTFVPSQWETALLCYDVSHWLGASLESALLDHVITSLNCTFFPLHNGSIPIVSCSTT